MENRTRVIFYCVRRWASFLVSDFIRSALLRAIDSRNTFPLAECCLQVYNINIFVVVVVVLIWGTFMAHEFIISERGRERKEGFLVTWPIDFLSGCPVSAQHAQLDRCCDSQSMCARCFPFWKRPTTIYSTCEKKIENYNWFQKRPFVGGKTGGSIF